MIFNRSVLELKYCWKYIYLTVGLLSEIFWLSNTYIVRNIGDLGAEALRSLFPYWGSPARVGGGKKAAGHFGPRPKIKKNYSETYFPCFTFYLLTLLIDLHSLTLYINLNNDFID